MLMHDNVAFNNRSQRLKASNGRCGAECQHIRILVSDKPPPKEFGISLGLGEVGSVMCRFGYVCDFDFGETGILVLSLKGYLLWLSC